jgi:hypothetical protein
MAEYISREEAIKELREVYENEYPTASGDFDEYASHYVPNVLRNIPAADVQPVDRWTSIEESKPKDMQEVLAVVDGDVREAFYNAGCFIGSNFYRSINEVKWWQPLPEPPKDGDTE